VNVAVPSTRVTVPRVAFPAAVTVRLCPAVSTSLAVNVADVNRIGVLSGVVPESSFAVGATSSVHHVEVGHHAGRVMLEDVAVEHPAARTVVRDPRDTNPSSRWNVDGVLP
jgi:hypothetical protein